jgi:hypothetical protein
MNSRLADWVKLTVHGRKHILRCVFTRRSILFVSLATLGADGRSCGSLRNIGASRKSEQSSPKEFPFMRNRSVSLLLGSVLLTLMGGLMSTHAYAQGEAAPSSPAVEGGTATGYPPPQYPMPSTQQTYVPPPQFALPQNPQEADRFGQSGQLVLTGGVGGISISDRSTSIAMTPAIDCFVGRNFSIGGGLLYQHSSFERGSSSKTTGLNFRLGFNLPFGNQASMWLRVSNGFIKFDSDLTILDSAISAPVMIHIVPHFFLAIGPGISFRRALDSGNGGSTDVTHEISIDSFIGGWW